MSQIPLTNEAGRKPVAVPSTLVADAGRKPAAVSTPLAADAERKSMLFERLTLEHGRDRIISVVGSGGKTTLIHALARESFARGGKSKIAVTTTTHILRPSDSDFFVCDCGDVAALGRASREKIIVAGSPADGGKLCAPDLKTFGWLLENADLLLIEADGSRGLPIKLPAAHEPVIPPQTDRVIVVAGMSALGQPLSHCCHRAEAAAELLGISTAAPVTAELLAELLLRGYRRYSPTVVLTASGLPPPLTPDINRVRALLLAGGVESVAIL